MSIDILCGTMHDNVCTKIEWLLEVRAGESVVDNKHYIMSVSYISNSSNIDQSQQRIGRCFQPEQFRVWANGPFVICNSIRCYIAGFYIIAPHNALKETIGAPVK